MFQRSARILEHVPLAERTFRIRLECPDVAGAIRPGQFVMMRLPNTTDPLLGRPFALYDTVLDAAGSPIGIDIVYLVVGKMTGKLAALVRPDERNADPPPLPQALLGERWESKSRRATSIPASGVRAASSPVVESACDVSMPTSPQSRGKDEGAASPSIGADCPSAPISSPALEVWGPLGRPFLDVGTSEKVTLVAGGIGQTPFLAYARELLGMRGYGGDAPQKRASKVSLFYGVRTAALAAGVPHFLDAGVEVNLASDDGSIGTKGFVTQLVESRGKTGPLVGCGPEPMLHAVMKLAAKWDVPCQVSLETPMACGIGICFSCVTKVKTPDGWDFKRVCVDGPVFDAAKLVPE